MKQSTREAKILEQAALLLGRPVELPKETQEDIIREAQSVVNYFESSGKDWYHVICGWCEEPFAYIYTSKGVKYCSVPCMDSYLKSIGLFWDPNKLPGERWGRYVPAVVPPSALVVLQEVLQERQEEQDLLLQEQIPSLQEDLQFDTDLE